MCLNVEFYTDGSKQNTTWYKGTFISYSRQSGYIISFYDYDPGENKTINSLKKAGQGNEIKIL